MPHIDPTARVADGARIADDVEIGPYCIVGPRVELKSGVRLQSHVSIAGDTVLGKRAMVFPFVSLGTAPQSTAYRGEPTKLVIGDDCQFREGATVSIGTVQGGGITTIGNSCFMMASSHVAHDCVVGNSVTFANNVALGGHVIIGDHVFIGGQSAVHQFNWVGEGAMIGGVAGVTKDVIPFGFAMGPIPAYLAGLNVIGLKRRGYSRSDLERIRRAYRMLFQGPGTFAERTKSAAAEFAGDPLVGKILDFIRAKRRRQLMMAELEKAGASDEI
ncbi:MAG: acyl-ACP--UDP-N-acetylglucosamine O-acyltransferase [Xanthobacteraceae bacterium]